jgi:hypothetical protein
MKLRFRSRARRSSRRGNEFTQDHPRESGRRRYGDPPNDKSDSVADMIISSGAYAN